MALRAPGSLLLTALTLLVVTGTGDPGQAAPLLPGALAAAARDAGLHVGAAVDRDASAARRDLVAREFTSFTAENPHKWTQLAPAPGVYDFSAADELVDWAEDAGLRIRGHTLFWGRLNGTPPWVATELAAAADPRARFTELMQTHAATTVGRYAGRIAQWDVVNEPLALFTAHPDPDSPYVQTFGNDYLDIAFEAAHAADPTASLFLNETLTELPAKFDGLVALVEDMLARGVPLDGVGLQGHLFLGAPDRAVLQAQLERIAALGLLVELTEVDIPLPIFAAESDPLAAQAEAYADVFAACLAVAACTGVTVWGIDDSDTWLDSFELTQGLAPTQPLLFDATGAPKPAYDAVVAELRAVPEPMARLLVLPALALAWRRARSPRAAG